MSSEIVTVTGRQQVRRRERTAMTTSSRRVTYFLAFWTVSIVLLIAFVGPYVWMLSSSFKSQTTIFRDANRLGINTFLPVHGSFGNYRTAVDTLGVARALLNSVIVAGAQVGGTMLLCIPAAYALTRLRFGGQKIIFAAILITFMVPAEAIIVPLYQIVSGFGLANTLVAVFIPFLASPFGLFLLRQAFLEVPREYDEAAKTDGAGHWRILRSIIIPSVRPAIASLALVTFLFSWNAFLWPLIITSSASNDVVQVAIAVNNVPGELPNWGAIFAGSVLATLPVLLLFMFLQRYFVRGLVMAGLKG